MKEQVHPDYHDITVVMTDGTEFVTRSTYSNAGAKLILDIDPKVHPAWTGVNRLIDRGGQLDKFNKRFAGLTGKKPVAAKAEQPAEKIKLTTTASDAKKKAKKA